MREDLGESHGEGGSTGSRLDSWKAIADYLGRHVSTVQRWEHEEALPIRRHQHEKRGSVYAFTGEIDAWLAARSPSISAADAPSAPIAVVASMPTSVRGLVSRRGLALAAAALFVTGVALGVAWMQSGDGVASSTVGAASERAAVASSGPSLEFTDALAEYRRGRSLWNRRTRGDFRLATKYYTRALEHDPQFGLAYAGLADIYSLSEDGELRPSELVARGTHFAKKAIALDPASGEAVTSLAWLRARSFDWVGAEAGFLAALRLSPNHPPAHYWYAALLAYQRRCGEAVEQSRQAEQLEPASLPTQHVAVVVALACGRLDDAERRLEMMRELDPAYTATYGLMGKMHLGRDDVAGAIDILEQAVVIKKGSARARADLALAYARAGRRADAQRIEAELRREHQASPADVPPWALAVVTTGLGQVDEAITWLERAWKAEEVGLRTLAVDGRFTALWQRPRFRDLLRRLGLPTDGPPETTARAAF